MHRMADKIYRVQATPLGKGAAGGGAGRSKFAITPKTKPPASKYDDSPLSSPEPEAPQLNAEIFGDSPLKPSTPGTAGTGTGRRYQHAPPSTGAGRLRFTPQPGTSVLTPAKGGGGGAGKRPVWDSDDDDEFGGAGAGDFDDDDLGASPPKTMQFHIPQSRLMKTPGRPPSIPPALLFPTWSDNG